MNQARELVRGGEFLKAVSGAGVVRVWEVRRACAEAWSDRDEILKEEALQVERETAELGAEVAQRRALERQQDRAQADRFLDSRTPLWRIVAGFLDNEDLTGMHPNDRGMRFTRLIRAVERMVRYEWRAFEKRRGVGMDGGDPVPSRRGASRRDAGGTGETGAGARDEVDDPRVRWWDPMRAVCEQFGMAYSALSKITREVCGLSASDLTDRVKAESVRSRMRAEVKAWVLEVYQENKEALEAEAGDLAEGLWACVQAKRGRGRWSRQSWAVRFGYSSYTRFVRASLAEYGVTPVELEREIVEEVVRDRMERGSTGAELEQGGSDSELRTPKYALREGGDTRGPGTGGEEASSALPAAAE